MKQNVIDIKGVKVTLNPEFKEQWVKALRSGRYNQTTGNLCDRQGNGEYAFCCLGVACDIAMVMGRELSYYEQEGIGSYMGRTVLPPKDLADFMFKPLQGYEQEFEDLDGIYIWDFPVTIGAIEDYLYCQNDIGVSFDKIADAIEEQL